MKFFTPELYVASNSADPQEAERAIEEWENANNRYRRHYRRIAPSLPEKLRFFNDECCLHDADLFGPVWLSAQSVPWNFNDVALVVQNVNTLDARYIGTLMILQYACVAEPQIELQDPTPPFHRGQPIWLYDEIDVMEPGVMSHEIMVSDGRIIKLAFRDFQMQIAKLVEPGQLDVKGRSVAAGRAKLATA